MRGAVALLMMVACAPVRVSVYSPGLHRVGRFDDSDPAGPRFVWSGSRFSLKFFGESVRVKVVQTTRPPSVEAGPQPLRVRVSLDGAHHEVYADAQNAITFVAAVVPGEHRLTLVRQSEALVGEGQLAELELSPGAKVLPWEPAPQLFEFIGDSITVGFGDEGVAPCPFSSQTEALTAAFPWRVGEAFHADVRVVAWSGHGVTRAYGDRPEPTVPEQWVPAEPAPDVVFVALGANDFWDGDPGEDRFVQAYAAFIERIRAAYPKAAIYAIATGPKLAPYVRQGKATLIELEPIPEAAGKGCVGHPSAKGQQWIAEQIIERLCPAGHDCAVPLAR